jgi:hypothetical protein
LQGYGWCICAADASSCTGFSWTCYLP